MKPLVILLLFVASIPAHADAFYTLVGYTCDIKSDRLLLTYDGASDEEGEAITKNKKKTQWNPWELVTAKDEDHIGEVRTVTGKCRLSDGIYNIAITPSPGNFNVQGRCGAWMTAGATVKKGNKIVYSIQRFENSCFDMDSPIVTKVTIRAGSAAPEITSVKWDDFYK